MNFEQARFNMIEQQIRPWDVLDQNVLQVLTLVRREDFVPPEHRPLAFVDMELPLPAGQCMLSPKVEARLLQQLNLRGDETVLEVGAGSGYMAALLGRRSRRVLTLELEADLVRMARASLQHAGASNVEVRHADGAQPLAEGPFDVILLSGSLAQLPQELMTRLTVGGRLAAIIGDEPMMRATVVTRTGDASWQTIQPWDTVAPRLRNFPEPSRFKF